MKSVHSERLTLIPLSREQMRLQMDEYAEMERSLGLDVSGERLERELRPLVQRSISFMSADPVNAIWYTYWVAISDREGTIIGGLNFKGPPDQEGEVEIGYGTLPQYRRQGFMAEAVEALVDWALEQDRVESVLAETRHDNIASMRVLQRAGFQPVRSTLSYLYWRYALGRRRDEDAGEFSLFDLTVVVEEIHGHCTCNMQVGDRFFLEQSSSLSLPDGKHFCVYALQSALPLLPAKQRSNHPADWMESDSRVLCPDPACGLVMRIDRSRSIRLHHDDVSPIPWDSIE